MQVPNLKFFLHDPKLKFSYIKGKEMCISKIKNFDAQSKSNIKISNSTNHFFQEIIKGIIARIARNNQRNYCEDCKYISLSLYMLCENVFQKFMHTSRGSTHL